MYGSHPTGSVNTPAPMDPRFGFQATGAVSLLVRPEIAATGDGLDTVGPEIAPSPTTDITSTVATNIIGITCDRQ